MDWFNPFGLVFMLAIMIPNIIYAARHPDGFANNWNSKTVEIIEQIGRYGCFALMIFNIPGTWFGWWSDDAFALYLIINAVLVVLYCLAWMVDFQERRIFRAAVLSVLPSLVFLFSAVTSRSVLLGLSALLFAPAHILISCKNAAQSSEKQKNG